MRFPCKEKHQRGNETSAILHNLNFELSLIYFYLNILTFLCFPVRVQQERRVLSLLYHLWGNYARSQVFWTCASKPCWIAVFKTFLFSQAGWQATEYWALRWNLWQFPGGERWEKSIAIRKTKIKSFYSNVLFWHRSHIQNISSWLNIHKTNFECEGPSAERSALWSLWLWGWHW